jgi:Ni,Fe-hydrogenase III large subunit
LSAHQTFTGRAVDAAGWSALADDLAQGRKTLSGLWGDRGAVHMAVLDGKALEVVTLNCADGSFPSVGQRHPPAQRLERAISDLFGLVAEDAPDTRRWLDHGRWGLQYPLGSARKSDEAGDPYGFLHSLGHGLHQIPVGPVHAGTIEPGHFRFTAGGETVVRLEERLGYAHKGIELLMSGKPPGEAVRLAGRVSGDSTVAYSIAFARATEAALAIEAPRRAHWLRGLMAELERVANHLGDIGAICNDAGFTLMHSHTGILRERVLRAAQAAFGHRLMMDCIVPGGVLVDLSAAGDEAIRELVGLLRRTLPGLVSLYDGTTSLQGRTVDAGVLSPDLARTFGCGGFVARASGRDFDTRRDMPYPPYDELKFEVPILSEGDVNARVWVRIREVEQSLSLIEQILDRLPQDEVLLPLPSLREARAGLALVEGFRGDILCWLRLNRDSTVERCHLRDPSWFQWPLLETAIEGNIVADFPLCNKSFNCSYSGHDL